MYPVMKAAAQAAARARDYASAIHYVVNEALDAGRLNFECRGHRVLELRPTSSGIPCCSKYSNVDPLYILQAQK